MRGGEPDRAEGTSPRPVFYAERVRLWAAIGVDRQPWQRTRDDNSALKNHSHPPPSVSAELKNIAFICRDDIGPRQPIA